MTQLCCIRFHVVLPEDQDEFERFAKAVRCERQPQGAMERLYVGAESTVRPAPPRLNRMGGLALAGLIPLPDELAAQADTDLTALGQAYASRHKVLANLLRHERHLEGRCTRPNASWNSHRVRMPAR